MTDNLTQRRAEWEDSTLEPVLQRFPERRPRFSTSSGEEVERIYLPQETPFDYSTDLGFPGEYPFTRGIQPTMYRGRLWTMRQYAGYATAEETNARYKFLLSQGQTGLSVAFDLPTQIGYDADHPLASGEVGRVGVSISSLQDMETLLDGIPLDSVSISMTINAPAALLLTMVIAVGKKQGVETARLRGTIQNDILKEYVARGTYIFPPGPSMRLITDTFRYCAEQTPRWNTISISGYHMREAGCTAVQEVAFTLANGIEYVQAALGVGLDVDDFAGRLSFFFNAHNNLLEEVAKFRAARRLWSKIMRERFGATNPRSCEMRFHTQTAGSTLTAQQPDNNVVRVALQALSAVLGGTQSLHTNSRDEALALPSEQSVQIALRTQQIIAHESGVADTIDPLAGSYYVEHLTDEIERQAADYIGRIDNLGGSLRATELGFVQREIQEAAYRAQQAIEQQEQVVVGVNKYATEQGDRSDKLLRVDQTVQQRQEAKLARLRQSRDNDQVQKALERIKVAASQEDRPLLPLFLEAIENYATLGEVCEVLRTVFGEYSPHTMV